MRVQYKKREWFVCGKLEGMKKSFLSTVEPNEIGLQVGFSLWTACMTVTELYHQNQSAF